MVCIFAFTVGQGAAWNYISSLHTSPNNFKSETRGKVVGALMCYFGLCSATFTKVYALFYDVSSFFLTVSIVFGSSMFVFGLFCNVVNGPKVDGGKRIYVVYGIAITIAFHLAISSIIESQFASNETLKLSFIIALGVLYFSIFILIPFKLPYYFKSTEVVVIPSMKEDQHEVNVEEPSDKTVLQALATPDYYFIFIIYLIQIGAGVSILNNMAAIVISKSGLPANTNITLDDLPFGPSIPTFIVLFAVFNTLGRLSIGFISDFLMRKVYRITWMMLCTFVMAISQTYFAFCNVPMIYGGVAILGLCYGGTFALIPTLISEMFGLKHFGGNYGLLGIAPSLGSIGINALLAGSLANYFENDRAICILNADTGSCSDYCLGDNCYRYTFLINAALCLIALSLSYLLRNKKTVKKEKERLL